MEGFHLHCRFRCAWSLVECQTTLCFQDTSVFSDIWSQHLILLHDNLCVDLSLSHFLTVQVNALLQVAGMDWDWKTTLDSDPDQPTTICAMETQDLVAVLSQYHWCWLDVMFTAQCSSSTMRLTQRGRIQLRCLKLGSEKCHHVSTKI